MANDNSSASQKECYSIETLGQYLMVLPKYITDTRIDELEHEDHKILVDLLEKDELYMELIPKEFPMRDVEEIGGRKPTSAGQRFLHQCMSVTNRTKTIGEMRETIETFQESDQPMPKLEALVTQLDTWINSSDDNYSNQTRIEDLTGQDFRKLEPLMDDTYKEIAHSWKWSARDIKKCSETKSRAETFLNIWNSTKKGKLTIGMIVENAGLISKCHAERIKLLEQLSIWIGQDALCTIVSRSEKASGRSQKGAATMYDNRKIVTTDSRTDAYAGEPVARAVEGMTLNPFSVDTSAGAEGGISQQCIDRDNTEGNTSELSQRSKVQPYDDQSSTETVAMQPSDDDTTLKHKKFGIDYN